MAGFNLNEWSRQITLLEGGKINLGISQVKEVMKITLASLARLDEETISNVLKRYADKKYSRVR
jgi:hypothetical protein